MISTKLYLGLYISMGNLYLFVRNITKYVQKTTELIRIIKDVFNVIMYPSALDTTKDRSFLSLSVIVFMQLLRSWLNFVPTSYITMDWVKLEI